jgi:DNA-binding NarL/FixJ family response regulator
MTEDGAVTLHPGASRPAPHGALDLEPPASTPHAPFVVLLGRGLADRARLRSLLTDAGIDYVEYGNLPDDPDDAAGPGRTPVCVVGEQRTAEAARIARVVLRHHSQLPLVVTSDDLSSANVVEVFEAGAIGCLAGSTLTPESAGRAVRAAAAGEAVIPRSLAAPIVAELSKRSHAQILAAFGLTKREHEILDLLARGMRTQEMADLYFVSAVTIRTHLSAIYRKLGVNDRAAALALLA